LTKAPFANDQARFKSNNIGNFAKRLKDALFGEDFVPGAEAVRAFRQKHILQDRFDEMSAIAVRRLQKSQVAR